MAPGFPIELRVRFALGSFQLLPPIPCLSIFLEGVAELIRPQLTRSRTAFQLRRSAQGEFKNRRKSRSRRGHEAEVFFSRQNPPPYASWGLASAATCRQSRAEI